MLAREQASAQTDVCDVGSVIDGRYRVLGRLGRGGAGSVYVVEDRVSGEKRALKRLADDAKARVVALFEREYYTLSGIRHPNVVEVYDYGTYAGKPYYTMELLVGSDLSGLSPVAHPVALAYVRDAAKALAALHARHLIHRDVAPRNLWLGESGALKLLDFGALTTFGSPGDVVGTPPFVAPEALAGQALDQRADLYALGALLYWLLTGQHAYPARTLRDLPSVWAETPRPPSQRLVELGREDLPSISEEVDNLTLALLSHDPSARPASAGEVIDRIASLVGGAPAGGSGDLAELVVIHPAFVGRQRERKHFARQLALCTAGRGGATLIEAERGLGASRLLTELALEARLDGALSVLVDSAHAKAAGGTLTALVQKLLEARPEAAERAFSGRGHALAGLDAAHRARLGVVDADLSERELRARAQDETIAGLCALSRELPLVLLFDDLEYAEDAAVAALADLADRAAGQRILLVCVLHTQQGVSRTASVRALSRVARRLTLRALADDEVRALVRSVFAEVPNLTRLVERVQRAARGNPLHITSLLRHLIDSDVIRLVDGTWVVPQELPDEPFTRSRGEALALCLERLSPSVRGLARLLSVGTRGLSLAACKAVSALEQRALFAALEQLVREGVLGATEDGYHFPDDGLRLTLRRELEQGEAQRAHLALGKLLLDDAGARAPLRIDGAVHMLEGGDARTAPAAVVRLVYALSQSNMDELIPLVPRVERALAIMRAQGHGERALAPLYSALIECGFFSDRKLAERYGGEGCALLRRITGVQRAERLRPYVGARLALVIGLASAAFAHWLRRSDPCLLPFKTMLVACIGSCTSMVAVAATCVSPELLDQRVPWLRPLGAFGKSSPLTLFADYPVGVAMAVSDDYARRGSFYESLDARLKSARVRRMLTTDAHARYSGGLLYVRGVDACMRESSEALVIADQLDALGLAMFEMSAAQIRTLYYANRGELELYEEWRARAEKLAIKRGTSWQVETWMPGAMVSAAFRAQDAMAMKHALEQLERLEKRIPSMAVLRTRAQGAYLVLRRRPAEALPFLEQCQREERAVLAGWSRAHGAYAGALNALGQHQRALEITERALRGMDERTRTTWAMTVSLQIERARARAALGDVPGARAQVEQLVRETGERVGAITRGALQEVSSELARIAGDGPASDAHFNEMTRLYRSTGLPSLAAHVQILSRRRQRATGARETREFEVTLAGTTQGQLTVQANQSLELALGRGETRREVLAERVLRLLSEQVASQHGALWLSESRGISFGAKIGDVPVDALDAWVRDRMLLAGDDDVTQTDFLDGTELGDPNQCTIADRTYQLLLMTITNDGREQPVAAAVFERSIATRLVSGDLLRLIGGRLFMHVTASSTNRISSQQLD